MKHLIRLLLLAHQVYAGPRKPEPVRTTTPVPTTPPLPPIAPPLKVIPLRPKRELESSEPGPDVLLTGGEIEWDEVSGANDPSRKFGTT